MSAQPPETGPVTAADVQNIKFQLIRRGGYDPAQVDPFLEVLAETIAGGPTQTNASPPGTSMASASQRCVEAAICRRRSMHSWIA